MRFNNHSDEFSSEATHLIEAVIATAPPMMITPSIEPDLCVGYIAGALSAEDAAFVELAAVENAAVRRQLSQTIPVIEAFKRIPYRGLVLASRADSNGSARSEWLRIIDRHVEIVTQNLRGVPPTKWPSLALMSRHEPEGMTAAKTIWRALFSRSAQGKAADGLLRLGFGYRLSQDRTDTASPHTDDRRIWNLDGADVVTVYTGDVHPNGDIEFEAVVRPEIEAASLFISFTLNGRSLALVETEIVAGRARVYLESLGRFMGLPVGPLAVECLSASTGGWPEQCEVGQIIVESGPRRSPFLGLPMVRDGNLELSGYFEETEKGGKWELLLAVSPNSWQLLDRFDIKGVIERPQVLKAQLPKTAMEGPFGGALHLRRL